MLFLLPLCADTHTAMATGPSQASALDVMFRAAQRGNAAVVDFLVREQLVAVDQGDEKGRTALHLASNFNRRDMVETLSRRVGRT